MAGALLMSSPYYVLPSTLEKTQVVLSLPPVVSETETSTSAHVCTWDFKPPVFLSHFRSCYSVTTVCFIYSFIHLISYESFNYITPASEKWNKKQFGFRLSLLFFCTVIYQMDSCNITWHKKKFAVLQCSNGSFAGTVSVDVRITTTMRKYLYHHVSDRFMHVSWTLWSPHCEKKWQTHKNPVLVR